MKFTFDTHGNIVGGIVNSSLDIVQKELVEKFPNSTTRYRNYTSLIEFIDLLKTNDLQDGISKLWLDGSFCTNKENPRDIDLVLLLKPINTKANIINRNGMDLRKLFLDKHLDIFLAYDCIIDDTYIENIAKELERTNKSDETFPEIKRSIKQFIRDEDYHMKYWMGQFGFDRQQQSKAIISISGGDL